MHVQSKIPIMHHRSAQAPVLANDVPFRRDAFRPYHVGGYLCTT